MNLRSSVSSLRREITVLAALAGLAAAGCGARPADRPGRLSEALGRSASPPGGLAVASVPQLVAVTFDDNFNTEGMDWANSFFRPLVNPAGSHNPATFDGTPVRTTFPSNSVYLSGMQSSWQVAVNDGHEIANHTVDHADGIAFSTAQWSGEVGNCTSALAGGLTSQGRPLQPVGFRSPYLHYDDNLFTVLVNNGFLYDSSIMGCWANGETAQGCPWPYTMESGSADADAIFAKWSGRNVVPVTAHPGLWELPVSVLFVPDDSLAGAYGFSAGLRQRVQNRLAGAQNPNFFEPSTGKLVGMDITMLLDAQMTRAEALATLKYTLDQRLAGNRAPLVFVAHTHVYASNWDANAPGTPNTNDRRSIIQDFVTYALSKPQVRMRPMSDLVAWMKSPAPLGACTPTTCAAQGQGQGKSCGSLGDGCGGTLSCGSCLAGQTCSANVCVTCIPTTCAAQGQGQLKSCGSLADGCGGTLACGACPVGQTCSASNVCEQPSSCASTVASYTLGRCAATALYSGKLYRCLSQAAGVNGEPTGCGTAGVYCSSIKPDDASWGATAWSLVQSCDSSCTPTTCAAQGKSCGSIGDGCGGTLGCGSCPAGQTCSSSNVCQAVGGCSPSVASYALGTCNATVVYQNRLYQCSSQTAGVNGGATSCGTPGVYCSAIAPDNAAWGGTAWKPLQSCP